MSPDFIARGFQLDEPHVFLAWGLTEEELQALMGADLHRVTTGYYTASCMSLGGLRHKLGFHFKPRAKGTLQKLEFFQTSYVNYKTSFEEFQGHFEKIFGLPSNIYSGDGGMPSYEWKFPGVTISHFLLDRFGLEQHLWIEREFESN